MTPLDEYEKKILRELQRDAKQTTAEIAEKVGLSPSPEATEEGRCAAAANRAANAVQHPEE